MKSKIALVLLMAAIAIPSFAATCPVVATVAALQALGSCTVGTGDQVTFSNFTTSLPQGAANNVTVTLNSGSAVGLTFSNNGTATAYTVSYTATCNAGCLITGGHDSATENPAGSGTYNWSVGGNLGSGGNFNVSFAGVGSLTTSGTFSGGATNQSITMNLDISPNSGVPEPTSLILFGSGFLAVGLAARARKRSHL